MIFLQAEKNQREPHTILHISTLWPQSKTKRKHDTFSHFLSLHKRQKQVKEEEAKLNDKIAGTNFTKHTVENKKRRVNMSVAWGVISPLPPAVHRSNHGELA